MRAYLQLIHRTVVLAGVFLSSTALAQNAAPPTAEPPSYESLPPAWNIPMNIAGVLSVGAKYCTQRGKCKTVGEGLGAIPLGDGRMAPPEIGCRLNPEFAACVAGRLPVQLLARTASGSVIIRLEDRNYAATGTEWALEKPDGSAIGGPIMIEVQGELSPLHYELRGMTKASRLARVQAIELNRKRAIASVLGAKGRRCDELVSVEKTSEGGEYTATCMVKGKKKLYREYVSGLE